MKIIYSGSLKDGFGFYGPFTSYEEAKRWGLSNLSGFNCHEICELNDPKNPQICYKPLTSGDPS